MHITVEDDGNSRKVSVELYNVGSSGSLVGLSVVVDGQKIALAALSIEGARLLGRSILTMADTIADFNRDHR
jgi:hypothetical protein